MAEWRVARSLSVLRTQINALFPNRRKDSDGTIAGSAHHIANPNSDHEPWVVDNQDTPIVTAMDITHDPHNGVDTYALAEHFRQTKDPRVKYVISNRRIFGNEHFAKRNNCRPWEWVAFHGTNPHDHHVHVSVESQQRIYDNIAPWDIHIDEPAERPDPLPSEKPVLRRGSSGADVVALQRKLGIKDDGNFGPATYRAVKQFQTEHGLVADGVVGFYTWQALDAA